MNIIKAKVIKPFEYSDFPYKEGEIVDVLGFVHGGYMACAVVAQPGRQISAMNVERLEYIKQDPPVVEVEKRHFWNILHIPG